MRTVCCEAGGRGGGKSSRLALLSTISVNRGNPPAPLDKFAVCRISRRVGRQPALPSGERRRRYGRAQVGADLGLGEHRGRAVRYRSSRSLAKSVRHGGSSQSGAFPWRAGPHDRHGDTPGAECRDLDPRPGHRRRPGWGAHHRRRGRWGLPEGPSTDRPRRSCGLQRLELLARPPA